MSYGYSLRLVELNKKAAELFDPLPLGVELGRLCIAQGVSVIEVSETLGVSRQTVYNWFIGVHDPNVVHNTKLLSLIKKLKR